jgi:hypothetical protein
MNIMKNGNKPWTIKEQEYLVENNELPIKILVLKLERTKQAIRARIIKLKKDGTIEQKPFGRIPRKANEIFQWEKRNPETKRSGTIGS